MSQILAFSPKTPTEKVTLAFNFATIGVMGGTEAISSQGVDVSTFKGTDPTPASLLNGAPYIDPDHPQRIFQKIKDGVDGNVYHITAWVQTNLGNRYEIHRLMKVEAVT